MLHGDISNRRNFNIGFQCEGTLLKLKDNKIVDKALNKVFGGLQRAEVDEKVLLYMKYLFYDTDYSVSLVVQESNFNPRTEKLLYDFPCSVVCNSSIGNLTSMLFTGELSYLIDNDIMRRTTINSKYCMSFEDFNILFKRGLDRRNL